MLLSEKLRAALEHYNAVGSQVGSQELEEWKKDAEELEAGGRYLVLAMERQQDQMDRLKDK